MSHNVGEVFSEFLDGRRVSACFGAHREISDEQRERYSNSAANLVEEVFMRMPRNASKVEISHGEDLMLRELFEQIVIDLNNLPSANDIDDIEQWRKVRIEGLERVISMLHGVIISNILLQH